MNKQVVKRYAVTAIGKDRPGIVAGLTKALYKHGCNIEDSSMTTLEDEFAVILIMSAESGAVRGLSGDIKKTAKELGLIVSVKEIGKRSKDAVIEGNYIITLHGADSAGIVYKTSALLAGMGVNITGLETKLLPSGPSGAYLMLMEVYLAEGFDAKALEQKLNALGQSLGVSIRLKPVEAYEPL